MAVTIAIVMLFVSVMGVLIKQAKVTKDRELARILVVPRTGGDLPLAHANRIRQIDGVKVVLQQKGFSGKVGDVVFHVIGEQDEALALNTDIFPVTPDVIEAWKQEKRIGAIVGLALGKHLNLEVGQVTELPTPFGPMKIKVVGFSTGGFGYRVSTHYDYVDELTGKGPTVAIRVFAAHADVDRVSKEIIERTKGTDVPATTISDTQFMAASIRRVAVVPAIFGFLGAFLLLTTTLTLANNNAIAIRERRAESATLRVVGYRRGAILRMMLGEAVLVGVIGAVIAIIVIRLVFADGLHMTIGTDKLFEAVKLTPFAMGVGLVTAVLVTLAGALPAALASVRTPLVKALRDNA
jgi:putative ABC transport system permease protein